MLLFERLHSVDYLGAGEVALLCGPVTGDWTHGSETMRSRDTIADIQ